MYIYIYIHIQIGGWSYIIYIISKIFLRSISVLPRPWRMGSMTARAFIVRARSRGPLESAVGLPMDPLLCREVATLWSNVVSIRKKRPVAWCGSAWLFSGENKREKYEKGYGIRELDKMDIDIVHVDLGLSQNRVSPKLTARASCFPLDIAIFGVSPMFKQSCVSYNLHGVFLKMLSPTSKGTT